MKKRYTEEQMIKAVKSHEAGRAVEDICRELSVAQSTFYNWRSKYAKPKVKVNKAAKRLRELEAENKKLKKLLAKKTMERKALEKVLSKKW